MRSIERFLRPAPMAGRSVSRTSASSGTSAGEIATARDRLDREEVDREHARSLRSEEGTPGQSRTFAGRAESRFAQDLRNGRRRDGDAEPVQIAGDPLVAPARVLAR